MVFMVGFNAKPCMAGEYDAEMFGFSYHFNKHGADADAPDRLNHDATWVFNLGIALGTIFVMISTREDCRLLLMEGFLKTVRIFLFTISGPGEDTGSSSLKNYLWKLI